MRLTSSIPVDTSAEATAIQSAVDRTMEALQVFHAVTRDRETVSHRVLLAHAESIVSASVALTKGTGR
jgi:hypothetical protein